MDSSFCEQCGKRFGTTNDSHATSKGGEVESRLARNELARLRKAVHAVRSFYIVTAFFTAFFVFVGFLLVLATPGFNALLVFAVTLSMFIANIVGAIRVTKEPFFWALSIASLNTVTTIVLLPEGSLFFQGILLTITAALWASVSKAAQAQKILDAHPELSLAKNRSGRNVPSATAGKSRLNRQAKNRRKETLVLTGVIGVVLVCAILVGLLVTASPSIDPSAESFRSAWQVNDTVAIGNLFAPERRARGTKNLKRILRRRGWTTKPPVLGDANIESLTQDKVRVTFQLGGGQIVTTWQLKDETTWQLTKIETDGFVAVSGPEPSIARFKKTWAEADVLGLIDFFALEQASRARRVIDSAFNRPGWKDHPPAFLDQSISPLSDERVRVTFTMSGFTMSSTWEYRSPFWKIVKIKIPRP